MEDFLILKIFITCEGRYSILFIFHLQFLLHLTRIKRMNLPYYFSGDLKKMDMTVQANPKIHPHRIYHHGLIKVIVKGKLGKLQNTWDQYLNQSSFEKKVHPPAVKSHEKVANLEQGNSSSASQPTTSKKRKRETCVKTPDEPLEYSPTRQQVDPRSSRILGGSKHLFPFAQKNYSIRSQRQVKPRVLREDKKSETTEKVAEPIQPK
jgi:hypothetical protein